MESSRKVIYKPLGLQGYQEVWDIQKELFNELLQLKLKGAKPINNYLITCQHHHVITLGKSGNEGNLQIAPGQTEFPGVEYIRIDRGGDITYHGPGQLVLYPILDLEQFGMSLRDYIHHLEEVIIVTLATYGLRSGRIKEFTGVWLNHDSLHPKKIAAIGVKSSRHITMHGLAFNINTDLNYFNLIIPCGLVGKEICSLSHELGNVINFEEVSQRVVENFNRIFQANTLVQT
jgi:lipoyl(octanoyl) transferase